MWFSGQFVCPPKDGQYEDEFQCDKYYVCEDGVAEEMLCKDGLVFDPFKRSEHKCDHLANVDCGDRLEMRKSSTPQSQSQIDSSIQINIR